MTAAALPKRPRRPRPTEYGSIERVIGDYILDLEAYATALEAERDHWKANHDAQVAIKRRLHDAVDAAFSGADVRTKFGNGVEGSE